MANGSHAISGLGLPVELVDVPPIKDLDAAHPVASKWRPVLAEIVRALARGDYELASGVPGVAPVSTGTAAQIEQGLADHGATLIELPEEAWETSIAQWMGDHWEVLIDLWTQEEGCSDLVLHVVVAESGADDRFSVHLVYVP